MLTAFLAIVPFAQVSFSADMVTVKSLVASLSSQSGVRLVCSKELESEVLVAQFKECSLDEVSERLTEALDARWVRSGEDRVLTRPVELRTRLAEEETGRIVARLGEILGVVAARAESEKLTAREAELFMDRYRLVKLKPDALMGEIERMGVSSPVARSSVRMLGAIGAKTLASIDSRDVAVYSDAPTPMQKALPTDALEALRDLKSDLKLLEAGAAKVGKRNERLINVAGMPEIGPGTLKEGYGKTLLKVTRTGSLSFSYSLVMTAKDGKRLLVGSGSVPGTMRAPYVGLSHQGETLTIPDQVAQFAQLPKAVGFAQAGLHYAQLADGKKITGSFAVSKFEKDGKDPVGDLRKLLRDPVTNDPVGLSVGPLLRQAAGDRPLIASVSDGMITAVGRAIGAEQVKTHKDLFDLLEQRAEQAETRIPLAAIEEREGWMILRPYLPVAARGTRMDRAALRDLIAQMRSSGTITLADAGGYYKRTGRLPNYGWLDWMYLTNVDPTIDQTGVGSVFGAELALLASLAPGQWTKTGEDGLSYVELTGPQKKIVDRWVYGSLSYDSLVPARGAFMPFSRTYPLDVEPTEMFPKGVPSRTRLKLEQTQTPVAIAKSTKGFSFVMDSSSLGLLESLQEDKEENPDAAARVLTEYRLGRRIGYRMRVELTPQIAPILVVQEVRSEGSPGARSSLPESFLTEANLAKGAYDRQRIQRQGGL